MDWVAGRIVEAGEGRSGGRLGVVRRLTRMIARRVVWSVVWVVGGIGKVEWIVGGSRGVVERVEWCDREGSESARRV